MAIHNALPVFIQCAHTNPVIERLHGQMQILIGFQLNHDESVVAIQRQQVQHSSIARAHRGNLRVDWLVSQIRQQLRDPHAQARLQPTLRLHAKERIDVLSIRMAAVQQTMHQLAKVRFVLRSQKCFIRARTECDFFFHAKRMCGSALPHARKFQSVQ